MQLSKKQASVLSEIMHTGNSDADPALIDWLIEHGLVVADLLGYAATEHAEAALIAYGREMASNALENKDTPFNRWLKNNKV